MMIEPKKRTRIYIKDVGITPADYTEWAREWAAVLEKIGGIYILGWVSI